MKKHFLIPWVLCFCLVLSLLPVTAGAAEIASGTSGPLTWVLTDDGILTISGEGEMGFAVVHPWDDYRELIQSVVIEEGVTGIGYNAFYDIPMSSVSLPESLEWIGANAFRACSELREIVIPQNVNFLGDYAFAAAYSSGGGCPCSIRTIRFEGNAPEFGIATDAGQSNVFKNVAAAVEYPLGNDTWTTDVMQNYGGYLQWMGYQPENAPVPEGGGAGENVTWELSADGTLTISGTGPMWDFATYWEQVAIEEDWGIRYEYVQVDPGDPEWDPADIVRVIIEEGVTNVGSGAFDGCSNLVSVSLAPSVSEISEEAFRRCASLTEFTIPETVTTLGSFALADTGITSLTIPGSITHVPECLMYSIYSPSVLNELIFQEGVESVGREAFRGCANLEIVQIPDSLRSFGSDAFYGCQRLKERYESVRQELTLDRELPDEIEIPALYSRYYTFTPAESREYRFTTTGTCDTIGTLLDEEGNRLAVDEDGGYGPNFAIDHYLEAGKTYLLRAELFIHGGYFATESNGSFCVLVSYAHNYVRTVQHEPSCDTDGIALFRCDCCGDSYTEIIPGGHLYENGSCIRCGSPENYLLTSTVADRAEDGTYPAASNNQDNHFYYYYSATPIDSHLQATENGYLRVEHINGKILIEEYDEGFHLVSKTELAMELPLYGGIYLGENYNFVVCGQPNPAEDNSREVIRVIRYSKNWVREDAASLCGANTTIPFRAASLRFAECEDMLYIRTGHQMYMADDGLNHQANVTLGVRISDMEITINHTEVSGSNFGYVSHSFDQFIRVDGDDLLALDLGDAYPRAVVAFVAMDAAGKYAFAPSDFATIVPFYISQTPTYQYTGVSLGGFDYSDTHYIAVGNAVDQSGATANSDGQRNLFVSATPKADPADEGTVLRYLTDFAEGDSVELSPPHMVKINGERFFLTWTENGVLRYCFINGSGELTSEIFTGVGALSDCEPIYHDGRIIWYVTNGSVPRFYQLELYHAHSYDAVVTMEPGADTAGALQVTCPGCGEAWEVTLPALSSGEYTLEEITPAGCTEPGENAYTWNNTGYGEIVITVTIPALGHEYETVATEPSCTEGGYTTHTCLRCGDSYVDSQVEPVPHRFGDWAVTIEPTCMEDGEEVRSCTVCGHGETRSVDAHGHSYVDGICEHCGQEEEDVLLGDVNGDGSVNNIDAMLILQYAVGLLTDADLNLEAADVNSDGSTNNIDAMLVLQFAVGLLDRFN